MLEERGGCGLVGALEMEGNVNSQHPAQGRRASRRSPLDSPFRKDERATGSSEGQGKPLEDRDIERGCRGRTEREERERGRHQEMILGNRTKARRSLPKAIAKTGAGSRETSDLPDTTLRHRHRLRDLEQAIYSEFPQGEMRIKLVPKTAFRRNKYVRR